MKALESATDRPIFPRRQPSCSLTCEHGCKQWTGCQKWRDAHPDEPYQLAKPPTQEDVAG